MSDVNKNLGHATAYGYAKSKGYTGTEDEFATLMASYADVAEQARESAEDSEAWAVGERDGVPVPETDAQYQNNSKHYAEQASTSAGESSDSAEASGASALVSEGHATGSQDGEPVEEGSPYYHNNAMYYSQMSSQRADDADGYKRDAETAKTNAETAETNAETAEGNAEAWAVGTKDSIPVTQSDLQYQNNAKYYAEQAAASAATSAAMTGLAPQFDSTKAYSAGDYVLYSGVLYQFTAAHAAGAWTGTDATAVTLAPEVTDLKSQIDASQIVCNASGAIASFADGSDGVPVRDLTVALEPVQDLHGQESPYPAGGGKNKFQTTATTQTINGKTFTVNADGSVTLSGTATASIGSFMVGEVTLPVGTYKVNGVSGGAANGVRCTVSNMSKTPLEVITTLYGYKDVEFELQEASNIRLTIIVPNGDTTALTIYPMIRLASITDNTFAPYSNECPISGWDSGTVWGTGRNIFDDANADWISGKSIDADGNEITSANYKYTNAYTYVKPSTAYTLQIDRSTTSGRGMLVAYYDQSKTFISRENLINNITVSGVSFKAFTTPSNAYYLRIIIQNTDVSNVMLETGSTASPYSPYVGASYHSDFPSTVYGGTWAVTEGEIAETLVFAQLDDFTTYIVSGQYHGNDGWAVSVTNIQGMVATLNRNTNFLSSVGPSNVTYANTPITAFCKAQSSGYPIFFIKDSDSGLDSTASLEDIQTAVNAWLHAYTPQIVYVLATPSEISVTPHSIPSLLGDNNVWSDCGDVSVDYVADPKLYIEQLTEPDADMIADSNITSGSYFMVGNQLFLATSNIASGGAITPNVNCTRTNLAEALNALNA